jgi:hypothetical protein
VKSEYSGKNFCQCGLIKGAGIQSKKDAKFPALAKNSAGKSVDKEGGYLSLQAVSRIEVELLGRAVPALRWLLNSSVETEGLVGGAQVSGQGADMEGDVSFDVGCIRHVSDGGIAGIRAGPPNGKDLGVGKRRYEGDGGAEGDGLMFVRRGIERSRGGRDRREGCFLGIDGSCASCKGAGRAECARGRGRVNSIGTRRRVLTRGRRGKVP